MLDRILLSIKYCPYNSLVQARPLIVVSELSILLYCNYMYVLSDHYIILRKSNRDGGVVRLHVNAGYFCLPHQSRVPHLHVNRPLHSKGVIKDCSN